MSEDQFTIKDCTIYGIGATRCVFAVKCEATIEARTKEKTLCTKSGAEYLVSRKEYALVICRELEEKISLQDIEEVEEYNLFFAIQLPKVKHTIENITPERIDLDGDWTFRISDEDGRKLFELAKLG